MGDEDDTWEDDYVWQEEEDIWEDDRKERENEYWESQFFPWELK